MIHATQIFLLFFYSFQYQGKCMKNFSQVSALVMFLNDDRFMSLSGFLWTEETPATLFYQLVVVILKLESEFLKGLDVVNVHHIYP